MVWVRDGPEVAVVDISAVGSGEVMPIFRGKYGIGGQRSL